jgi:coenzyme PQQ precursor peptide PqqA
LAPGVGNAHLQYSDRRNAFPKMEDAMKIWNKPQVLEQAVGLEVTSYMPAEIDII